MAFAHQPRVVFDRPTSEQNPVMITNPEISRAYYGQLNGSQDYYKIVSDKPFTLYLNILTPYKLEQSRKDFMVEVRDFLNKRIVLLDGKDYQWELYYESFGNDYYMKGPEISLDVSPGIYYMNLSSADNTGRYSLAVGEIESFPINEIFKTYYTVPKIKTQFFDKPFYLSVYNYVGLAMLVTLLLIIFIIVVIVRILRGRKKRKLEERKAALKKRHF